MTQDPAGDDRGQKSRRLAVAATVVVVALIVGGIWWSTRSGDDGTDPASAPSSSPTPTRTADDPATDEPTDEPGDEPTGANIFISTPEDGATVDTTFTVTGQAAAFEGTVEWELTQDGKVVEDGFTTAEECCTLSPYSFEVTAEPGSYTLTVRNTDPSDGEGGPVDEDSREITVR